MISIITPVFSDKKLKKLANSISNQTNKNFEWILVVDTVNLNLSWCKKCHDRVKIIHLKDNYGPSVARNVGFMVSDGDIIAYADADDELMDYRVEQISRGFLDYPDARILFTGYIIKNGKDESEFIIRPQYLPELENQNICIPLGVAHTRELFIKAGMFQRGIVCGEDGILWRRMYQIIDDTREILINHSVAGIYTVNETGQSRTQRRFEQGGFAFDNKNPMGSHGQYLDEGWFTTFQSVPLFDKP
jgi:glycosyltransferase involved in cell wall biosynthesis